jgi:hypothetical protein
VKAAVQRIVEMLRRLSERWPAERVFSWSRRLANVFMWAAPLCFVAALALNIHNDAVALRENPEEAHYDVPTTGESALMFGFMLSLVMAAVFSVIASIAKGLLPRNFSC